MKKAKYLITVRDNGVTCFKTVSGYYDYIDGLPLAAHKTGQAWVITELSTGLAVITGTTRKEAFEKVQPMTAKVKELIQDRFYDTIKDKIKDAYTTM